LRPSKRANQEYVARSLKLVRLMGMLWPTLELMLGLALVLVLWIGGREVLAGRMQIGAFTAFNIYMMQLTFPSSLWDGWSTFSSAARRRWCG
jgi:ATP-binding cassette subfamily B multidrug efflux pump